MKGLETYPCTGKGHLAEVRRARRQDDSVGLKRPTGPRLAAGQGAVHERLVGEEILKAGAEAGLVIVPLQTILLGLAHCDKRLRGERTSTDGAISFTGHKALF